ncbi:hypothetical protein ACFE04_005686 [Oxalis oulophora]
MGDDGAAAAAAANRKRARASSSRNDPNAPNLAGETPSDYIIRIMRKVVPPTGEITCEAKDAVWKCVTEFTSLVTSYANKRCMLEHRRTLSADDLLWALGKLGFDKYHKPLTIYLEKYRESERARTNIPGEPICKRRTANRPVDLASPPPSPHPSVRATTYVPPAVAPSPPPAPQVSLINFFADGGVSGGIGRSSGSVVGNYGTLGGLYTDGQAVYGRGGGVSRDGTLINFFGGAGLGGLGSGGVSHDHVLINFSSNGGRGGGGVSGGGGIVGGEDSRVSGVGGLAGGEDSHSRDSSLINFFGDGRDSSLINFFGPGDGGMGGGRVSDNYGTPGGLFNDGGSVYNGGGSSGISSDDGTLINFFASGGAAEPGSGGGASS